MLQLFSITNTLALAFEVRVVQLAGQAAALKQQTCLMAFELHHT